MTKPTLHDYDQEGFLPTTYLAVLTIIGGGAEYGYEINKILEERNYRDWVDIKLSSVYKALNELEKRDLIRGKKAKKALRPSKKTYTLTSKGKRHLRGQIIRCLSKPPAPKSLFDLGMSAIFLLTKEEALDALRSYMNELDSRLSFLGAHVKAIENLKFIRESAPDRMVGDMKASDVPDNAPLGIILALFKRPYVRVQCEREWLGELIDHIERREDMFQFKEKKRGDGRRK